MRVYILCVYWTLLLVSVVSSGFLFLLVALEGAQAEDPSFHSEKNETYEAYNNITLNYDDHESFESSIALNTETQAAVTFKATRYHPNNRYRQEETAAASANFEKVNDVQEKKDADVLVESLMQQPNLSQGISETGQAVVLTLVDTAAAELQNLVEPKVDREFSSESSVKNSSLLNDNQTRQSEHPTTTNTQIPPSSIVDETTEQLNDTDVSENEKEALLLKKISEEAPEVVVIVRAEQKANTDELELRVEEEDVGKVSEELPTKIDDTFTTAPELNDTAARAQLLGGSRDESAAVILDGLVTSGPTDPHEDIPSFSEWAQKRLEEAEKKKTHPNVSVQTPGGPGRGVSGMKIRSKNYASPDCGAKIVVANPEATSAKNVLVSTRDEYMLNACTSRIWFVVELCEAIQAKKIELANFELFSSSPKDFSVYVSDRYPTKDWSPVGQFTAKDVKDVQSFALHPHFFGKFIKVELQSYYGSEHFCPISLFRAYGTSEFEVLETETENQILQDTSTEEDDDEDSDEEELLDSDGDSPPRNLFGSARDAVLSIMKKAAEVLVKSSDLTGNNITEIQQNIDGDNILENSYTSCMTPRYTILCGNCTDQKFASVFQLVSCRDRQLDSLLKIDLVNKTLRQQRMCGLHGVEIESFRQEEQEKRDDTTHFNLVEDMQAAFLVSVFKPEYIVALCNVLATKERKVVMNTSYEISVNSSKDVVREDILAIRDTEHNGEITSPQISVTLDSNSLACKSITTPKETRHLTQDISEETRTASATSIETSASIESLASQIKPTKTLGKEDLKKESSAPILEPSKEVMEETLQTELLTPAPSGLTPTLKIIEEPPIEGTPVEMTQTVNNILPMGLDNQEVSDTLVPESAESTETNAQIKTNKSENRESDGKEKVKDLGDQEVRLSSQDHIALDTLFSDLKDLEGDTANMQNGALSSSMTLPTASSTPQKESVFLRLSNRIKILERNMSLSGQYLEELSRRYKKQVEEMQRSLERAVAAMSEESRKGEEREAKRMEEIAALREEIAVLSKSFEALLYDQDSWRSRFSTIIQHVLLICLEIILIILILSYCRRGEDFEEEEKLQSDTKKQDSTTRRKSTENFTSHSETKKMKKQRSSEIASHISGTYHELMVDDRTQEITKKERKKKRKKETTVGTKTAINSDAKREAIRYKNVLDVIPGGTTLPSRRASSIDPPRSKESQDLLDKRPESAPETAVGSLDGQTERKEQIVQLIPDNKEIFEVKSKRSSEFDHQVDELSNSSATMDKSAEESEGSVERKVEVPRNGSFRSGILKGAKLSSPSFMKTALASRNKRKPSLNSSSSENCEWNQNLEHSNDRSAPSSSANLNTQIIDGNVNGNPCLIEESDESRSSSATPTSRKKDKRGTGLKKMVRKFF